MTAMLHKFNENILLWGNSGKDVVEGLPEFNQDYIFSYILNSYGLLAGICCSRDPGGTGSVYVRNFCQTEK